MFTAVLTLERCVSRHSSAQGELRIKWAFAPQYGQEIGAMWVGVIYLNERIGGSVLTNRRAATSLSPDRVMKISKTEAHYGRGTQQEHCGKSFPDDKSFCRHFIEPGHPTSQTGTCTEVTGSIGRVYFASFGLRHRRADCRRIRAHRYFRPHRRKRRHIRAAAGK